MRLHTHSVALEGTPKESAAKLDMFGGGMSEEEQEQAILEDDDSIVAGSSRSVTLLKRDCKAFYIKRGASVPCLFLLKWPHLFVVLRSCCGAIFSSSD